MIAEETSEANLRWAGNTLTTNGVTRGRAAHRDRDDRRQRGHRRRRGLAQQRRPRRGRVARARRRGGRPHAAGPPRTRAPLIAPAAAADAGLGRRAGRDVDRRLRRRRARARRGVRRRPGRRPRAVRLRRARAAHDLPRHLDRRCGCATTSRPAGSSSPARPPTGPARPGSGTGTRDFTDVDMAALDAELARRLGWAERRVDLPAGRYETLLPPSAVADLMIYQYWSRSPATPTTAGRSSAGRAAAPGSASACADAAAAHVERPGAPRACECAPFVCRDVVRRVAVGLRQRPAARRDRLDPRRRAHGADPDPALGRADRPAGHPGRRQPADRAPPTRPAAWTRWSPTPRAACC